jgi:hypothetical protein
MNINLDDIFLINLDHIESQDLMEHLRLSNHYGRAFNSS